MRISPLIFRSLGIGVISPSRPSPRTPLCRKTRVRSVVIYEGDLPEAFAPMSVTLQLEMNRLGRGHPMLVSLGAVPHTRDRFSHGGFCCTQSYSHEVGRTTS